MPDAASQPPASSQPLLTAEHMTKSFGGVTVLRDVPFDLRPGEVHTLLGENGAGKSTLLKLLAGVHTPDSGTIRLDGKLVTISSPLAAQKLGISLIHQEPLSFPDLNVAENIFIGRHGKGSGVLVHWSEMYRQARQLLDSLGVNLNVRARLRGLSIADQQMVELAAALSQHATVLLMDEPTAALTPGEVDRLFRIVRRLRDSGTAIVFISHRLEEVFAISDRITILRDGQFVGVRHTSETNRDEIIQMMVGRPLSALYERDHDSPIGKPLLKVDQLSSEGRFADISFEVKAGEIVGLAGLVGAGRTDVAQTLFGIHPRSSGTVTIDDKPVDIRSPRQAIEQGVAYVPEDRQQHGLVLPFPISSNTSMATLDQVSSAGVISGRKERDIAEKWRTRLKIRLFNTSQAARELSGGNQQKVVLGKWLQTDPRVLILDEPTRGIDIGAKTEVHHLMGELARQGKAILMISSDLPEVLAVSDRVLVMREGRLTAQFTRAEATQENVMSAATGQVAQNAVESISRTGVPPVPVKEDERSAHATKLRGRRESSGASKWLIFREIGVAVFIVVAALLAGVKSDQFFTFDNIRNILSFTPLIMIVAMGQMMVIVSRNIDLSVGSMLALSAIVVGYIFVDNIEFPVWLAFIIAMGVGGALGLINGVLVTALRVPAIIATLGTLTAYRGLTFIYSGAKQVNGYQLPPELLSMGVVWLLAFALVVVVVTLVFLRWTRLGRYVYAVGSNPHAAQLRGIPVKRTLLLVFTLTGVVSGLAGILYAPKFGNISPSNTGDAFELVVISAVIIGGTSVFGGSGTVLGVLLGCLLLGVVDRALSIVGIAGIWQKAFYGSAILLAATVDTFIQRRLGRSTSGGAG